MFRDEMIDIALLVMILGIVVSLGLGMAIKTERQARKDSQVLAEDKNTRELKGYGVDEYGDFDGTFTKSEIVLLMQVQDYYMPEPKEVTILDTNNIRTKIEIVSTYKENLMNYGIQVFNKLNGYSANTKFNIRYDRGTLLYDTSDDTYLIEKAN